MLVLSRNVGEKVLMDNHISVTVMEVSGSRVRLAFDGPEQVHILRTELPERPSGSTDHERSELAFVCEW